MPKQTQIDNMSISKSQGSDQKTVKINKKAKTQSKSDKTKIPSKRIYAKRTWTDKICKKIFASFYKK